MTVTITWMWLVYALAIWGGIDLAIRLVLRVPLFAGLR